MEKMDQIDVAIIGAGPYGLSLAAHLREGGINFRIFGKAMEFWRRQMPEGMCLKSEGFASNFSDPKRVQTLQRFCREQKLEYSDTNYPVQLKTFFEYGLSFQKRMVPTLEENYVTDLRKTNASFSLRLDNGELVNAKTVVLAVGCGYFQQVPSTLAQLPNEYVTHSSQHHDLSTFKHKRVAIVGSGASATDLAGLLHQAGADAALICRVASLYFHDKGPDHISPWQQIRRPLSGIGAGWPVYVLHYAPWFFHAFPEDFRLKVVNKIAPPAGGWFMKDMVIGRIPLHLGCEVESAAVVNRRVHLKLRANDGSEREVIADHVIAATGYRVNIGRLDFLCAELRAKIAVVQDTPILSAQMESSVAGLYFTGLAAANSFGPVLRFVCGTQFSSKRLTRSLTNSLSRADFG